MGKPLGKLFIRQGEYIGLGAICQNGTTYLITPSKEGKFTFDGAQKAADMVCNAQTPGNLFPEVESLIMRSRDGLNSSHVKCKDGRAFSIRDEAGMYGDTGEVKSDLRMTLFMADMACGLEELPPPLHTPSPPTEKAPKLNERKSKSPLVG